VHHLDHVAVGFKLARRPSVVSETRCRLEVAVKDQRIEVCAVGPDDGAQLVVDVYLSEEVRVGQWLEYRATKRSGEVDVAGAAVADPSRNW
jgi:hypothetical protein